MKRVSLVLGLMLIAAGTAATAVAAALLANPGFESGSLSGWTTINNGSGGWGVNNGSALPRAGDVLAPAEGGWDAVFDMDNPSSGVLYQDFVVPGSGGQLSFSFAYRNKAEGWAIVSGSEFALNCAGGMGDSRLMQRSGPSKLQTPFIKRSEIGAQRPIAVGCNQWISIDLLRPGADPETFAGADILRTIFRSNDSTPFSSDWQRASIDLSPWKGQSVRLRFAIGDTVFFLPFWVDAVSVTAGPAAEPNIGHIGYCSVEGNFNPFSGAPIPPGTFLMLVANQPKGDPAYKGAYPANFIDGVGITCDAPPAGYVQQGFAPESLHVPGNVYPYWVKGS